MKFRFSVRALLLITALVAVSIFVCNKVYEEYLIPRTPLKWKDCTAERLETILEGQRPVLICVLGSTYTLEHTSDFGSARPGFRRFVYDHNIELLIDPINGWNSYPSLDFAELTAPDNPDESSTAPEFVLVIPTKKKVLTIPYHATVYVDGIPDASKNTAEEIIDAIQKYAN